jgi:hypothetical protein
VFSSVSLTRILNDWSTEAAMERLTPLVFCELDRIAQTSLKGAM